MIFISLALPADADHLFVHLLRATRAPLQGMRELSAFVIMARVVFARLNIVSASETILFPAASPVAMFHSFSGPTALISCPSHVLHAGYAITLAFTMIEFANLLMRAAAARFSSVEPRNIHAIGKIRFLAEKHQLGMARCRRPPTRRLRASLRCRTCRPTPAPVVRGACDVPTHYCFAMTYAERRPLVLILLASLRPMPIIQPRHEMPPAQKSSALCSAVAEETSLNKRHDLAGHSPLRPIYLR